MFGKFPFSFKINYDQKQKQVGVLQCYIRHKFQKSRSVRCRWDRRDLPPTFSNSLNDGFPSLSEIVLPENVNQPDKIHFMCGCQVWHFSVTLLRPRKCHFCFSFQASIELSPPRWQPTVLLNRRGWGDLLNVL